MTLDTPGKGEVLLFSIDHSLNETPWFLVHWIITQARNPILRLHVLLRSIKSDTADFRDLINWDYMPNREG